MAGTLIEVDTVILKTDVDDINAELQGLRADSGRLAQAAAELGATWEGNSKAAFMAGVNDDISRLNALLEQMEKYTNLTEEARTNYETCENEVGSLISGLRI